MNNKAIKELTDPELNELLARAGVGPHKLCVGDCFVDGNGGNCADCTALHEDDGVLRISPDGHSYEDDTPWSPATSTDDAIGAALKSGLVIDVHIDPRAKFHDSVIVDANVCFAEDREHFKTPQEIARAICEAVAMAIQDQSEKPIVHGPPRQRPSDNPRVIPNAVEGLPFRLRPIKR